MSIRHADPRAPSRRSLAVLLGALPLGVLAGSPDPARIAPFDRRFFDKAAQAGVSETAFARLAAERSAHVEVRSFASSMADDHAKAHAELNRLACARGLSLAQTLTGGQLRELARLARLTPADFDRSYVIRRVDVQRESVADFEAAARDSYDVDLRDYAAHTLPVLQLHLQTATALLEKLRKRRS